MIFWDKRLIILLRLGRHSEMKRHAQWSYKGSNFDLLMLISVLKPLTLDILTSVYIFSILFSIHFQGCWQGELVSHQEFFQLVIISFILVTSMCDLGIVYGEIRCTSLLGVKGWSQYNLPENYAYLMLASRYSFNKQKNEVNVLLHTHTFRLSNFHKKLCSFECQYVYIPILL